MKKSLQHIILEILSERGLLSKEDIVPEAIFRVSDSSSLKAVDERSFKPEYLISRTLKRLEERGFVNFEYSDDTCSISLTSIGREHVKQQPLQNPIALHPDFSFDGFYRVVMLDFGEEDRKIRDEVRKSLVSIGCIQMRSGVWVTQHPIEEFIEFLREKHALNSEITLMKVADISPNPFEE
ncbi:MAG TPA: hypothetical protein VGE63_01015 [Candidatus Paceibacterota bacterium]